MSAKYIIVEKGQPGVAGGGTKKYYAQAVKSGVVTLVDLAKRIEKSTTMAWPEIFAALELMVIDIQDLLAMGQNIKLGNLGTFSVGISSEGKATKDEVDANCIKKKKVNFRPGVELKERVNNISFEELK
jgi:predicted histone-like DNA-binding protein